MAPRGVSASGAGADAGAAERPAARATPASSHGVRSLHPWRSAFKRADAFQYAPQYGYTAVRTVVGSLLTILSVILLLAYIGYTLNDFIRGRPLKTTTWVAMPEDMSIPIGSFPYSLAVAIETDADEPLYDPRVFEVIFRETTMTGPIGPARNRTDRSLGVRLCSVPDRPESTPTYLCPELQDGTVRGEYADNVYRYVRAQVALCSGPGCLDLPSMAAVAARARITFWLYFEDFDGNTMRSAVNSFSRRYFAVPNMSLLGDFFILSRSVTISPRFYVDSKKIMYPMADFYDGPMVPQSSPWIPGAKLMTVYLRAYYEYPEDEYDRYSFPKMVGDWGALWTAATLSLGWLAYQYNGWIFRRAVRKHLGVACDTRALVALDIRSVDAAAELHLSDRQVARKLHNLRHEIAAEVCDNRGSRYDAGETMGRIAARLAAPLRAASFAVEGTAAKPPVPRRDEGVGTPGKPPRRPPPPTPAPAPAALERKPPPARRDSKFLAAAAEARSTSRSLGADPRPASAPFERSASASLLVLPPLPEGAAPDRRGGRRGPALVVP